jgi:uncharacterized hydrophobic protein (TIGR00271 family)
MASNTLSAAASASLSEHSSALPLQADVPVSTTKALQVSIIFPRIHRVYVPPSPEQEDVTEILEQEDGSLSDNEGNTKKSSTGSKDGEAKADKDKVSEHDLDLDNVTNDDDANEKDSDVVGYVEGDKDEGEDTVEHVVTSEEMTHVIKIPATDTKSDSLTALKEAPAKLMKSFFGIMNKHNDNPNVQLTKAEAVEALKREGLALGDDKDVEIESVPNTEIRVEALVRLTFKDMLQEGHCFNAPIYRGIKMTEEDDAEDWVELTVMVKAVSIGLVLERLERIGIGSSIGTVSIFRAELCKTAQAFSKNTISTREGAVSSEIGPDGSPEVSEDEKKASIDAAKAEWKNAASRLRIEQVKEQIYEQAQLSFDFLSLLVIASILAGIGLIVDSTVVIVASMLVSPIMGPVMGITFGSRVKDWSLASFSFIHEVIALLICIIIGAIIGFSASWSAVSAEWPTEEMASRGDVTGLITGLAIAIPSGMGVALSILGNNTASLVGVAISASLLPPAVNTGICWARAILIRTGSVVEDIDNDYVYIGGISFALTIVNIICIWLAGMFMFMVKEVAPTKTKSAFWQRDIKLARTQKKNQGSNDVDLESIRTGLKHALEKEDKNASLSMRKKQMMAKNNGPRPAVTFNLSVNPLQMEDISTINSTRARNAGLAKLADPLAVPKKGFRGLEDMAMFLGFDDSDGSDDEGEKVKGNADYMV